MIPRLFRRLMLVLCLLGASGLAAQTTAGTEQVASFVEALRLAAPDTGRDDDGLYSEWQVKPDNITRWSKRCLGDSLSIDAFEADPAQAREVLECKMHEVLTEQLAAAGGDESVAVLRAAAWWMTGDPEQYDRPGTADYTQRVLEAYQRQHASAPAG